MPPPILMLGTFDSKGAEYEFLRQQLISLGADVIAMDTGVMGCSDRFAIDVTADEVARAGGCSRSQLQADGDRGRAMTVMAAGAAKLASQLYAAGRFAGIVGMGGSGGSSVVTAAMRALPLGVPKVCVSTVAGSDTQPYVGAKDVTLIPAITDLAGLNRISRIVLSRAAGAVWGMVCVQPPSPEDDRPIVVASSFGNTTACVDQCRQLLEAAGYEVLVFHATGTGGRTMESLIDEGLIDACLDITTTEVADLICGGVFSAGDDRMSAAGRRGIPHLIAPGCLDMCNFGPIASVPREYREGDRLLYEWNPSVTLMRTNVDENRRMGQILAEKANAARGPAVCLVPLRGLSILDGDGQRFCDRAADQALFDTWREHLRQDIPWVEVDANINDAEFAHQAVQQLLGMKTGDDK